jgi:hypothetical protein
MVGKVTVGWQHLFVAAKNSPIDRRFKYRRLFACAGRQRFSQKVQTSRISRLANIEWSRWRRCATLSRATGPKRAPTSEVMKPQDRYLKFVRWEEDDRAYVGYCPDLFPWGGICHADREEEAYRILCELVAEEIQQLTSEGKPLPVANTRPMREAVPA